MPVDKHCKEFGYDPQSCTSKPCEWNKGKRKSRNPQKVTEATYSSNTEKQAKLSSFYPLAEEVSEQQINTFVRSLKYISVRTSRDSMWGSLLTHTRADYHLTDDRRSAGYSEHPSLVLL